MNTVNFIQKILSIPAESRTIEFKRLGSRNEGLDRTLQSIIAMANTDGGIIVLGVADPQKSEKQGLDRIYGIEENLGLFDELGKTLKKISPPLPEIWPPALFRIEQKGVRIGLLTIPKMVDALRAYENHVYMRLEQGNKRLSHYEIIHFAYVKGFSRADIELVNVDFNLLKTRYYNAWRKNRNIEEDSIESTLERTGLAKKNNMNELLPTRAAVLLFAEYPNDLLSTKCTLRILQYAGKQETIQETLNLIGKPKTIGGPIIKQIKDTHDFVLNLLETGIRVPSGFITIYQIPERAIKEAITNAVVHRDYHTKRDIEIKIFENRVEIESPGLFPFNITPSNIGHVRAHGYRNSLLVKHLREFPDPPNLDLNEGVRAMRQTMKKANLYPPAFLTYPDLQDAVCVVLYSEKAPSEWDKISHFLNKNKYLKNEDVRKLLGTDNPVKVSKLLRRWSKQGLLTQIKPRSGAKKEVRYRLPTIDEGFLFTRAKGK